MANTILTHQMLAREAAAMLVEEDNLIKNINTGRSGEFATPVEGYKRGSTVNIGIPPIPVTFSGPTYVEQSLVETEIPLTLSTQLGVGLTFTAQEKLLELTDFKKRFLAPAMQSLRSQVQKALLQTFMATVPNVVGTYGTVPNTRTIYRQASSLLNRHLAPEGDRTILFSSEANIALAEANATLFHSDKEISSEFDDGMVGRFANFSFYENQSIPSQAIGAGAGYLVNGGAQVGNVLAVNTGTGAINAGQVFTIAGVYDIHPITGQATTNLRQFVVTQNYAGGAGNVTIWPAIEPTGATQVGTVSASPATGAAITLLGTASESFVQNLAFHKNAFCAAFAPLPVLASCEGYTATVQNVSVRVMTFGDGLNDIERTRVDVLFGAASVRPDHAVRITE
jgi:hypothetical protein